MATQGRKRPKRPVTRPPGTDAAEPGSKEDPTPRRPLRGRIPSGAKLPFDIDETLARIDRAIRPFDKAAMFELRERGHTSLFEQLIACVISIRTFDEVSLPAALRLFERARTPDAVVKLGAAKIDELIRPATFHEPKARTIVDIAKRVVNEFAGELPADPAVLMTFRGVGPKCAHLALGVAANHPVISVDVHVHRVTNRWAYVQATTPEKTLGQLEATLPKKHWVDINRLLVPFGKHVCTGRAPKCSTCPVLEFCRQVGVTNHR